MYVLFLGKFQFKSFSLCNFFVVDILQFCGKAASTVAKRQNLEEEGNCYCKVLKREVITIVGGKLRLLWF